MSTGPDQIDQHYLDAIADADPYPYWYDDVDEPDSQPDAGAHRDAATCASSAAATPGCGRRSSPRSATRRATSC